MHPSDESRGEALRPATPAIAAPSATASARRPYREPELCEQGDLAALTAGAFGDHSP